MDQSGDKEAIVCEIDGKPYLHRQSLKNHKIENHTDLAVACRLCDGIFQSNTALRTHINKDKHAGKQFNH